MQSKQTTLASQHVRASKRRFIITLVALIVMISSVQAAEVSAEKVINDEENTVHWHKSLAEKVVSSINDIGEYADTHWRKFSERMGFHTPRHIAAYRGYATHDTVYVQGRLLANKPYGGPQDNDNWWDNLKATYNRWESDEIPNAQVRLTYLDQVIDVVTDDEGYYSAQFTLHKKFPKSDFVTATHELDDRVLYANHPITVLDRDAEYLVISDVDDTVIHTGITNLLVSAQLTFLNNAKTRKPLPGVGRLYQSFADGKNGDQVNPIVYLSNSAWNMYDLLRDFIDLNDLPKGPLLLRDIGLSADSDNHKTESLSKLFRRYKHLPVVLVGDSGQHDADYYSAIAAKYPDRVKAIYIRDIDPGTNSEYDARVDDIIGENERNGIPFVRVQSSDQVAEHAVKIGLLAESELGPIKKDTKKDRARETVAERSGFSPQKDE